jgi:hypothetical protein
LLYDRRYNRVVFLCRYRFDTGFKKKLPGLNYNDLDYFAHTLLNMWGRGGEPDPPLPHPLLAPGVAAALSNGGGPGGGYGPVGASQPPTPSSVIAHNPLFRANSESQGVGSIVDGRDGRDDSIITPYPERDRNSIDFTSSFAAAASQGGGSQLDLVSGSSDDRASFNRPSSISSLTTAVGRQGSTRDLNIGTTSGVALGAPVSSSPTLAGTNPNLNYGMTAPAVMSHNLHQTPVAGSGVPSWSPQASPRVALPNLFVPTSPQPGIATLGTPGGAASLAAALAAANSGGVTLNTVGSGTPGTSSNTSTTTTLSSPSPSAPQQVARATSSGPMLMTPNAAGIAAGGATNNSVPPRSPLASARGSGTEHKGTATTGGGGSAPSSGTTSPVTAQTPQYPYTSPPDPEDDDEHCWMGDTLDMKFIDDVSGIHIIQTIQSSYEGSLFVIMLNDICSLHLFE